MYKDTCECSTGWGKDNMTDYSPCDVNLTHTCKWSTSGWSSCEAETATIGSVGWRYRESRCGCDGDGPGFLTHKQAEKVCGPKTHFEWESCTLPSPATAPTIPVDTSFNFATFTKYDAGTPGSDFILLEHKTTTAIGYTIAATMKGCVETCRKTPSCPGFVYGGGMCQLLDPFMMTLLPINRGCARCTNS